MTSSFPTQQADLQYLTEGGQETEIMYKFGFELREFALFPLLDHPPAVVELRGPMTAEEAEDYHSTQIATLATAEVDLVETMTFNNVPEAVGVARAATRAGLAAAILFTLDSNHRLHSGPTLKEAIEAVDAECGSDRPVFYGINCSHPLEFLPAIEPGDWFERVRCLRPNAAMMDKISLCTLGHLESGDPVDLGERMGAIAEQYPHLDIWGGCCGTWETHLEEIARNVRAR